MELPGQRTCALSDGELTFLCIELRNENQALFMLYTTHLKLRLHVAASHLVPTRVLYCTIHSKDRKMISKRRDEQAPKPGQHGS